LAGFKCTARDTLIASFPKRKSKKPSRSES
jgi:hypothetical protein